MKNRKKLLFFVGILLVLAPITYLIFRKPGKVEASKLQLTKTDSTIEINVKNRYKAVINTTTVEDFENYITIYDRAENDKNPDPTFTIKTPYLLTSNAFTLANDANRRTTILEVTDTRIKIQVKGKFNSQDSADYELDDDAQDDPIETIDTYTFTSEGIFFDTMVDFKDYLNVSNAASHGGYNMLMLSGDITDAAFDGTAYYGDGETETEISVDGTFDKSLANYVVYPGEDSYQSAMVVIPNNGFINNPIISGTKTQTWGFEENDAGTGQERLNARIVSCNPTGKGYSRWAFILKPNEELDTEVEREGLANDIYNHDTLSFSTGSQWDDLPRSQGVAFNYVSTYDEHITGGTGSTLDFVNNMTLEMWVYRIIDTGGAEALIERDSGSSTGYEFFINSNDDLELWDASSATSDTDVDIPLNQWTHVAAVVNSNVATFYVNGEARGGDAFTLAQAGSGDTVYFNTYQGTSENFRGKFDEIRMWSDVRTQQEIKDNMYKQIDSSGESELELYYRLNEGTGTTTHDETSNNYDGTLVNTPKWSDGYVPEDGYNAGEGFYSVSASSNHAEVDLTGGDNVSTLANDASIQAGDTAFTVDSITGFPDGGGSTTYYAYIDGDKFSYTDANGSDFTGIPSTGDNALLKHADNSVVSLSKRHTPAFKIRNYLSLNEPQAATLEGATLEKDYDYTADIKPFTAAYFAQDLTWYSNMDSLTAQIGTDMSQDSVDFVTGKYGDAVHIDSTADNLNFTINSGEFDDEKGAVEFWYKPEYDSDTSISYTLWRADYSSNRYMHAYHSSQKSIRFFILDVGTNYYVNVDETAYHWSANEWVHLRFEWDSSASVDEQMRIYINGTEPEHNDDPESDDYAGILDPTIFYIGDSNLWYARGTFDEFKIYDLNEQLTSTGGAADAEEYLATPNNYTFDFNAVDASDRGEYIWLGSESQFSGVNIDLATVGVGSSQNFDWEYWDGNTWEALTVTEQDSGASDWTGSGSFYFTAPGNWFPYSVNGSVDLFYIRGHLEGGSYTTDPIEQTMKTDIVLFQYVGDVSSKNQTFIIPGYGSGDDPILYWKFDEGYGTTVNDATDNNFDGAITGATWQSEEACISGKCLYYDGNDFTSITKRIVNDYPFTMEGWIRAGTTPNNMMALSMTDKDTSGASLVQYEGGVSLSFDTIRAWRDDGSSSQGMNASSDVDNNKWHHVGIVFESSADWQVYIDGKQENTLSGSVSFNTAVDNFTVGASRQTANTNFFTGFIDEVKVYRYARSADEIKSDFASVGSVKGVSARFGGDDRWLSEGLVGYWPFSETSWDSTADVVLDYSGLGGHGDLKNDGGTLPSLSIGKFDNGGLFDFDGSGYVETHTSNQAVLDGKETVTVSAWIRPDFTESDSNFHFVFGHERAQLRFIPNTDDFAFSIQSSDGTVRLDTTGLTWTQNTWHHIVGVYDGSTMYIYWDGELENSRTHSGDINDNYWPMNIGAYHVGGGVWTGTIDEVRLYNRALSSTEIEKLYKWAPGPVGYWDLNENSGTTISDKSGNGYDGDLQGGMDATNWNAGKFGSGLSFDGSLDNVQLSSSFSELDGLEAATLSVWVKPEFTTTYAENAFIFTNMVFSLRFNPNVDDFTFSTWTSGGATNHHTTGLSWTPGTWHHLSAVYDGADMFIYWDGKFETSTNKTGTFNSGGGTYIGADGNTGTQDVWLGVLDDLKMYDYARTPEQIVEDMNAGHPAPGSPVGSALGYWKFDEGYGSTANDSGTGGNNGTLGTGDSAPSWTLDGKFDRALDYDNSNDYVDMGDIIDLLDSDDLTISGWFNRDTADSDDTVLAKRNGIAAGDTGYIIYIDDANDTLIFEISDGTDEYQLESSSTFTSTGWNHFTAVWDQDSASASEIYINGKDDNATDTGTIANVDAVDTGNLRVGTETDSGNPFDGKIDDIRIYNFALSESQAKTLYAGGSTQVLGDITDHDEEGFSLDNPTAHWKLDEGSGTSTIIDYAGGAKDLTMNNFEEADWLKTKYRNTRTYALDFDGGTEYLSIADDDDLEILDGSGFTLAVWLKHDTIAASDDFIVTKADTSNGGYKMHMDSSGEFCVDTDNDAVWTPDVSTCTPGGDSIEYDDNEWHYVVFTRDGAIGQNWRIYVDGVTLNYEGGSIAGLSNSNALHVGMDRDGSTGGWDGQMSDIRIYDHILWPAQLNYLYNRSKPFVHYGLNECSGTTAYNSTIDNSGTNAGMHGTINIGPLGDNSSAGTCSGGSDESWANGNPGQIDYSLDFDGSDDYIEINDQFELEYHERENLTIEAWINRDTFDTYDVIVAKKDGYSSTDDGYLLYLESNDNVYFLVADGGNQCEINGGAANRIQSTGWHHIVGTLKADSGFGTSGEETQDLYIDGNLAATGSVPCGGDASNSLPLRIGALSGTPPTAYFGGQIDEVKIYRSYFTAEQVKKLYNRGAVRFE